LLGNPLLLGFFPGGLSLGQLLFPEIAGFR
jgi:hypothetical protein